MWWYRSSQPGGVTVDGDLTLRMIDEAPAFAVAARARIGDDGDPATRPNCA